MVLKAGSTADFEGSLAQAMDEAFKREWRQVMGEELSESRRRDLQLLLRAIAQGIVAHLTAHALVQVSDSNHSHTGSIR